MKQKEFIDSLFRGYEETAALADFKEELLGNLNAKIESFISKGMDADAAFTRASTELGDISALADELSLKKRKEVFEEAYMDIKAYMAPKRVAAYVIFGVVLFFGIAAACITLFAAIDLTAFFAVMVPFLTAAVVGFTWLGMTQETSSIYPVSKKRGAWYAAGAGLIAFGLCTMPVVYFGGKIAGGIVDGLTGATIPHLGNAAAIVPVIGIMIPFLLPGVGILVYLVFTEKDRLKPWARDFRDKAVQREMAIWQDPVTASRFGMVSGAIWIFAMGLFILLGFLIGFQFSWLVIIFAVGIQLLVQGLLMGKKT